MSGSGAKGLRDSFNLVLGPAGSCSVALLDYVREDGTEWQLLDFSGTWADGSLFRIQSDMVPPKGDVQAAARATAQRLLDTRGPAP